MGMVRERRYKTRRLLAFLSTRSWRAGRDDTAIVQIRMRISAGRRGKRWNEDMLAFVVKFEETEGVSGEFRC